MRHGSWVAGVVEFFMFVKLAILPCLILASISHELGDPLTEAAQDVCIMSLKSFGPKAFVPSSTRAVERETRNLESSEHVSSEMVAKSQRDLETENPNSKVEEVSSILILPTEVLMSILTSSKFATLWQLLAVSHDLLQLAKQTLRNLYTAEVNGEKHPHFGKILREFRILVQGTGEARAVSEACTILNGSVEYTGIKSFLEANFGHCIKHEAGKLPEFFHHNLSTDISNDSRLSLLLPYLLEHQVGDLSTWSNFIIYLAEHGREDLLTQVDFSRVSAKDMSILVAAKVPKAVIDGILSSPQGQKFDAVSLDLLALAGYGVLPAKLDHDRALPLWALWSSQQHSLPLPECGSICGAFSVKSLPFWMSIFSSDSPGLLKLLKGKGVHEIQMILRHTDDVLDFNYQNRYICYSYQAILTYLCFSEMRTPVTVTNFNHMLNKSPDFGMNGLYALLHCKQYDLIAALVSRGKVASDWKQSLAFIDKLRRAKVTELVPYFAKDAMQRPGGADFVKGLILRHEDDAYVAIFVDFLNGPDRQYDHCSYCFYATGEALRSLASGADLSFEDVAELLNDAGGYYHDSMQISCEVHVVHTLMFWEAAEAVLSHFIAQIPQGEFIEFEVFKTILLSTKYANDFVVKSSQLCKPFESQDIIFIKKFRPDLAEKLFLEDS